MNAMNVGAPKRYIRDLPSGPVAKTLSMLPMQGDWFNPWSGNLIPDAKSLLVAAEDPVYCN